MQFAASLHREGLAVGLQLPYDTVAEILAYACQAPCFADRDATQGFNPHQHVKAQASLGKQILLAQYFNTAASCPAINRLAQDPVLQWIACKYLESVPAMVGINMWWTYPVEASAEDRDLHAHLFHRDVDDFRFFKFFFYLTDVPAGEGAHVCVPGSHHNPPVTRRGDRFKIRRYTDAEIDSFYQPDKILEVCGDAGTGFAENTLCIHKGRTPESKPRLLLQVQYALFDYGVMHDRRDPSGLRVMS